MLEQASKTDNRLAESQKEKLQQIAIKFKEIEEYYTIDDSKVPKPDKGVDFPNQYLYFLVDSLKFALNGKIIDEEQEKTCLESFNGEVLELVFDFLAGFARWNETLPFAQPSGVIESHLL